MKKMVSVMLCLALLTVVFGMVPTASADMVTGKIYTYEIENLDASQISYYAGATQDFFDYGNGVSGTYIRVQNDVGTVGNYVEFMLDVPESGNYTVSYVYRLHSTSGVNQLSVNGTDVGAPRDFYDKSYGAENDMVMYTTDAMDLSAGDNTFRLTTTKLAATGQDRITVDYIQISSTDTTTVGYGDNVKFVSDFNYFDFDWYADPDHNGLQYLAPGTLTFDKSANGGQNILINGTMYTKGFCLKPTDGTTSVLSMPIPEGADSFKTVIGINDRIRGTAYDQKNVVTILIDGVEVYQTNKLTYNYFADVDLDIPYGAQTLTIRNNCGTNNTNDYICFGDARFETGTANDTSLTGFSVEGGRTLTYGNDLLVLTPEDTVLSAVIPSFTISDTSSCDLTSGSAADFSSPKTVTVTAENGDTAQYTIKAFAGDTLTAEEQEAVSDVQDKISAISTTVSASDGSKIEAAESAFEALSDHAKLLVSNYATLTAARTAYDAIKDEPLRVACVGDSITYGGVAAKSYPTRLQSLIGDDFRVYNFGVGGTTVSKNGNYPYWNTSSYTLSKEYEPDYVLIMFGTNDAQVANWSNCKDKIEGYYRDLIAEYTSLDSHPQIILATPAWYYLDAPTDTSAGSERYNAINTTIVAMVKALGAEYGFPVVDISAVTANHAEWFTRDGVHPDDTGYQAVAEAFAAALEPFNSAALGSVSLNGESIADFSSASTASYSTEGSIDLSALTFDTDGTVTTSSSQDGNQTQLNITVTSKNGKYVENYVLNVTDTTEPPALLGDVTGDGLRTVADVVELRDIIMKGAPTDSQLSSGDTDGSGTLTVADVVELRDLIMKG